MNGYNNILNLYVPNWIPCGENKHLVKKATENNNNVIFFEWDLNNNYQENEIIILIKTLSDQLLSFFCKLPEGTKVNIFINSFSQFCLVNIFDLIKDKLNEVTFINPFDEQIYKKIFSIKKNFLVNSGTQAIYKYMYLTKSMKNLRDNEIWINEMRNEVKIFNDNDLIYHKIFDQILRWKYLRKYLEWLKQHMHQINIIVGDSNPLINANNINNEQYNQVYLISNCGYCIWLEQPEALKEIVQTIINQW